LRIAIFHTSLPCEGRKIGGVEAAVHRLASSFAENPQIDVTVVSCGEKPEGATYKFKRIFPVALRNRLMRLLVLPVVLNFVDFRRFDVVHTHGDDWFWVWRRVPTVRTMHGSALREAQTATRLRRKLLQYGVYPLEQLSTRLATRSVAVGRDTMHLYRCNDVVGNGVDLAKFTSGAKTPFPMVVFIGLWEGRKRGYFAFRTFVDFVLPRLPDAQLHMVSDMTEDHPSVFLHTHPDDETLAALLSRAWVFCYPSVYEGFGIPYIEAMASGTPIVSSPNAGASDVLQDGEYGVICGDDEFGEKLLAMLTCPSTRQSFASRGVRRAKQYSSEAIATRYLEIYREVAVQC
jgi:glycosyltransferase involved in cell wall biosynthesis